MAGVQRAPKAHGQSAARDASQTLGGAGPEPSDGGRHGRSLGRLVEEATKRIVRFSAPAAFSASAADGVILDIRSQGARELHGVIPGSLHIPRTVLEWRIPLDSPWRNVHLGGLDQRPIRICDHGYSSILVASNLVQLWFYRAGDVIAGFESWRDTGLPIAPWRHGFSAIGALPGTGPPEQTYRDGRCCRWDWPAR